MPLSRIRNLIGNTKRLLSLASQGSFPLAQPTPPPDPTADIPLWYVPINPDPSITPVLPDLIRPGEVVYDVGAHVADMSIQMSRLVGPRGVVCAFEASARTVPRCQRALVFNGCGNVQLYHRAVYARTGELLTFYYNPAAASGDSLVPNPGAPGVGVVSLALDDFIAHTGLNPSFLKFDIEGGEYDALRGAGRMLEELKPPMILEVFPATDRAVPFLRDRGYVVIDLQTYNQITDKSDYAPAGLLTNVLCMHTSRLVELYKPPFERATFGSLSAADFCGAPGGDDPSVLSAPVRLEPGRYLFEADAAFGPADHGMWGVVAADNPTHWYVWYSGTANHLSKTHRSWVLDVPRAQEYRVRCVLGAPSQTFYFNAVSITRLSRFAGSNSLQVYF
jgi:FkbM family methyltransferase